MANPFNPTDLTNVGRRKWAERGFTQNTPLSLYSSVQKSADSSKFLGYTVLDPPDTAASASKFVGYTVLDPPDNATSASKFVGYTVLDPPDNATSASKFVGYVILQPGPLWRFQQDWPNPIRPRYPKHDPGNLNVNLFPPPPPPVVPIFGSVLSDFVIPYSRRQRFESTWATPLTLSSSGSGGGDDVLVMILWA